MIESRSAAAAAEEMLRRTLESAPDALKQDVRDALAETVMRRKRLEAATGTPDAAGEVSAAPREQSPNGQASPMPPSPAASPSSSSRLHEKRATIGGGR